MVELLALIGGKAYILELALLRFDTYEMRTEAVTKVPDERKRRTRYPI